MKITTKLFLIYLFVFGVICIGIGWFSYRITTYYIIAQGKELNQCSVNQFKKNIGFKLNYYQYLTDYFINDLSHISGLEEKNSDIVNRIEVDRAIHSSLNKVVSYDNGVSMVKLYTDNSNVILNGIYCINIIDYVGEQWLKNVLDTGSYMLETYFDQVKTELVVSIAKRYNRSVSELPMVVLLDIKVNELFSTNNLDVKSEYLFITNTENKMIYSNVTNESEMSTAIMNEKYLKDRYPTSRYIMNSTYFEPYGWTIYLVSDMEKILSDTKIIRENTYIIAILSILLSILATIIIAKRFSGRISRMVDFLDIVGSGDFDRKLVDNSKDEIGVISRSLNDMAFKLGQLMRSINRNLQMNKDIQLKFINAQINSHFLYNTLSIMNWMAIRKKEDSISNLILQLSDYYRFSLNKGSDITTLERELYVVKAFININRYNFDHKFDIIYEIEECLKEVQIIKLIIQPIVENALIHGIYEKSGKGTVILRIDKTPNGIAIEIIDDGVGISKIRQKSLLENQTSSLSIVNYRIKYFYGNEYGLDIFSGPGIGTRVAIQIPDYL